MIEKYINPHTDFGFKRLFGSEFNKELLISFLNAMFHGEQNVQDVTYLNSEQLGDRADARRAIFDVYCENDLRRGSFQLSPFRRSAGDYEPHIGAEGWFYPTLHNRLMSSPKVSRLIARVRIADL